MKNRNQREAKVLSYVGTNKRNQIYKVETDEKDEGKTIKLHFGKTRGWQAACLVFMNTISNSRYNMTIRHAIGICTIEHVDKKRNGVLEFENLNGVLEFENSKTWNTRKLKLFGNFNIKPRLCNKKTRSLKNQLLICTRRYKCWKVENLVHRKERKNCIIHELSGGWVL